MAAASEVAVEPMSADTGSFWEDGPIDLKRLQRRAVQYAQAAGASADAIDALRDMLGCRLAQRVVGLSHERLRSLLINDAYKAKMHVVYAGDYGGVGADFIMHVRRSPFPVERMEREDPDLYHELVRETQALRLLDPLPVEVQRALSRYYSGFVAPPAMLAQQQQRGGGGGEGQCGGGVAAVEWQPLGGELTAVACDGGAYHAAAASNTETSVMQLVQEYTVRAQVRDFVRRETISDESGQQGRRLCRLLDRTERLANSLGRLAFTVGHLNAGILRYNVGSSCEGGEGGGQPSGGSSGRGALPHISLFAGRRSTDRAYLLLQNMYCRCHLHGYSGTSAIYSNTLLDTLLDEEAVPPEQRSKYIGPLAGTLAHEVMSVSGQLMSGWDDLAAADVAPANPQEYGGGVRGPLQLSALLAHLLFLRANGGMAGATALPDTFGTAAFLALASVTQLPPEFVQDIEENYPEEAAATSGNHSSGGHDGNGECATPWRQAGAVVFDAFRVWRMDSGDYAELAALVMDTWERRCGQLRAAGLAPAPQPLLMHSNLGSWEEVVAASWLQERVRPTVYGFGTLLDGFMPFMADHEEEEDLESGAVKAVEAGGSRGAEPQQEQRPQGQAPTLIGFEPQLASVVMKAVQARHPNMPQAVGLARQQQQLEEDSPAAAAGQAAAARVGEATSDATCRATTWPVATMPCAGKIGDSGGLGKAQVDPRLSPELQLVALKRMQLMASATDASCIDGAKTSRLLRRMYVTVTRQGSLAAVPAAAAARGAA